MTSVVLVRVMGVVSVRRRLETVVTAEILVQVMVQTGWPVHYMFISRILEMVTQLFGILTDMVNPR